MVFHTGAALLDAIVLAVVAKSNEAYGYRITQDVRSVLSVSESTLYPVLRRLQKEAYLETYDQEYGGRNRRYYKLTQNGEDKLTEYAIEWRVYSEKINGLFAEVEG